VSLLFIYQKMSMQMLSSTPKSIVLPTFKLSFQKEIADLLQIIALSLLKVKTIVWLNL